MVVINYRALNKGIILEATPTPNIESAFHHLGIIFHAYRFELHVLLNTARRGTKEMHRILYTTKLYEYNYVPFGISNGSMALTELIGRVFGDISYPVPLRIL